MSHFLLRAMFLLRGPRLYAVALGLACALAPSRPAHAALDVLPGWDLLETIPGGTLFMGQQFTGVRLGTFDFGGAIGVRDVGTADTIVRRLAPVTVPGPPATAPPIPIELVALQLVSVMPFDIGFGAAFHYITLQSSRPVPGPASTGQMTIRFDNAGLGPVPPTGTFDSFFDVFFDLREGSLSGPIRLSNNLTLSSTNVPWSRVAPPGAVEIAGVNHLLNGVDIGADFWPAPLTELHPSGASHQAKSASAVPEPGSSALFLLAGALGVAWRRWRLHGKSPRGGSSSGSP